MLSPSSPELENETSEFLSGTHLSPNLPSFSLSSSEKYESSSDDDDEELEKHLSEKLISLTLLSLLVLQNMKFLVF